MAVLAAVLLAPIVMAAQENLAERKVRQLVEEERMILDASKRPDGSYDEDLLERRFQGLVHKYDAFIQENPEFAVGYVAYARLLERIGQEKAARVMYINANLRDPNIPLVKNQLGNFLAQEEKFAQALPYYLSAIELEPEQAIYHYQLGELLYQFRDGFMEEEIFTREVIDQKMILAFGNAARFAPGETGFAYRFAEAFYDLETPQWEEALKAWDEVERRAVSRIERQTVSLHRANIAMKQSETERARELLKSVQEPVLLRQKNILERRLEAAEAKE